MIPKKISSVVFIAFLICAQIFGIYLIIIGSESSRFKDVSIHPRLFEDWNTEDLSINIHGRVNYPIFFDESKEYPCVLLFHGMGRDLNDHQYLISRLTTMGIVCFSIDFRGHGESTGYFSEPVNQTFQDALGALKYVESLEYINQNKKLAFGISMGGGNSLFLAINNLVNGFVLSFPATGYFWGNQPLYMQNIFNLEIEGLLLAGTNDECGVCLPQYNQIFSENNPQINIHWFQGATHCDEDFWLDSMERTILFISNIWELHEPFLSFFGSYTLLTGIISVSFATIIIFIGVIHKKRLNINKKMN